LSGVGAGILTFLQKSALLEKIPHPVLVAAVALLSLTAAFTVFGLYKWELRNIQKCDWLINRAAALEKEGGISQYQGWENQQTSWGKTRSEKLIYRIAIGVWFVPIGMLLLT
jgi:hypothetical protein